MKTGETWTFRAARERRKLAAAVATHRHGRVPRELRRQQVLAEALGLFTEKGFRGASMDELARRVGVSKPVVYDLVGSKENLFRDLMAEVTNELTEALTTAVIREQDSSEKLRAGVLAFLRFVESRRAAWLALLSSEAGPPSAELAKIRRRQAEQVAQLVAADLKGDRKPDPLTSAALAQMINGATEFVALWWYDHPEISAEALADLLTRAFSSDVLQLAAQPLLGGGKAREG